MSKGTGKCLDIDYHDQLVGACLFCHWLPTDKQIQKIQGGAVKLSDSELAGASSPLGRPETQPLKETKSNMVKTCTSLDCPERKGDRCTSEETKPVDHKPGCTIAVGQCTCYLTRGEATALSTQTHEWGTYPTDNNKRACIRCGALSPIKNPAKDGVVDRTSAKQPDFTTSDHLRKGKEVMPGLENE